MAFKMTPGIKGNPTNNSIMGGECGGDGQPACPPRFEAEKVEARYYKRAETKKAAAPVKEAPVKEGPIKEAPVKEGPIKVAPVKGGKSKAK